MAKTKIVTAQWRNRQFQCSDQLYLLLTEKCFCAVLIPSLTRPYTTPPSPSAVLCAPPLPHSRSCAAPSHLSSEQYCTTPSPLPPLRLYSAALRPPSCAVLHHAPLSGCTVLHYSPSAVQYCGTPLPLEWAVSTFASINLM